MIKLFKNLTPKNYLMILISIILIFGQVWLDLELPSYMSEITNLVMTGGTIKQILIEGIKMLACALGSAIMAVMVGYFAARVSASFGLTLREKVFTKVQNFSMEEIKHFSTPSLITRSTNDISQVQHTIAMGMQAMVKAPILAIWAVIKILNKSWQWSLATGIAVFLLLLLVIAITVFAIPKFRTIQKQTDDLNRVTRENLLGTRVVRAYNAEEYEEEKFEKVNNKLTKTHLFVSRIMSLMSPSMMIIMNGLNIAIYWIGAVLINGASLQNKLPIFSDMVVFTSYAMQVVMAFMMLCMIFIILPRATVSANRINEVLNTKPSIKDGEGVSETKEQGTIEFKNVSFKYPDADEYVLKNVSFKANKGDTIAFIGSTGSGKSTLINLVPRFYDSTDGEIKIDGEDIKKYKLKELHSKIGYVPQKAVIFSGTIESNLNVGDNEEKTNEDIISNAIKIAQADEFVNKMPKHLESEITQGGTNISGGQKQRLAIARAVARQPEIYIFDDSFSALDYKTDFSLRKALNDNCKDATKLIVAQRIGTIKDADQIIVLNDGEVVGQGIHADLLKTCEVYKEIALSQLSKEELE